MSVSVVVVAYRSGAALLRCLDSLAEEEDVLEAIVVDNGVEGDEVERAAELPFVRVVSPGRNVGFPAGCNLGARAARGDVLFFLNPDTVVAKRAVRELARTLDDPAVGVAMPRLRLLAAPGLLNSGGNVVHLAGFAWAGCYGEPAEAAGELRDVASASGAAMAVRADVFADVGGFTEELFLYHEDLELSWRIRMCGLKAVVNPHADVYHDYEYERRAAKRYFLERNRLVFVFSSFSARLLVLLAPVLLAAEVAIVALAVRQRWFREKAAGWAWLVRNARWLRRHRRELQRMRRVRDGELATFLSPTIDPGMIAVPVAATAFGPLVALYWRFVRWAL